MVEQKAELLKKIIESAQDQLTDTKARSYFPLFVEGLFRHASFKQLQQQESAFFVDSVVAAWQRFQKRHPGDPSDVTTTESKTWTLTIINDDRPFLYDTVDIFLKNREIKPLNFYHPVWCVVRNAAGELQEIHHRQVARGHWESLLLVVLRTPPKPVTSFLKALRQILAQTCRVVDDWPSLQEVLKQTQNQLSRHVAGGDAARYLRWLLDDHFFFMGYRYFPTETNGESQIYCMRKPTYALGLFSYDYYNQESLFLPSLLQARPMTIDKVSQQQQLLTYAKINYRSPIHRYARISSIEVLITNLEGKRIGICQFIGLYTVPAFQVSVFDIPLVQEKARYVLDRFGFLSRGYDGKMIIRILESIPHDEIFAATPEELYEMTEKIMQLREEGLVALFLRHDKFGDFMTALVYMPQERYSIDVKNRFLEIFPKILGGTVSSSKAIIGDFPFACLIFVLVFDQTPQLAYDDAVLLEEELGQASLSWEDLFVKEVSYLYPEGDSGISYLRYHNAFAPDYQEKFPVSEALFDIPYLEVLSPEAPIQIRLYHLDADEPLKVKVYHYEHALSLSRILPVLQNLGLQPTTETPLCITPQNDQTFWIHDFELENSRDISTQGLLEAFQYIWRGDIENDGLNRLMAFAALDWRQVVLIRAYVCYLKQVKFPYSQSYIEEALITYPQLTRNLLKFFEIKFSPYLDLDKNGRGKALKKQESLFKGLLQNTEKLDHEQIFTRLLNLFQETLRTNFFQGDSPKSYLSFKLASKNVIGLPTPRPWVEIFIYSSRFQAVHMRAGKVARGGIRWSDRPEDFRTEILNLMKAQTVKNAIIVPFGSKGGFVLKNLKGDLQEEVVVCYRLMMQALLELTDNRLGAIIKPSQVVCYDDDDPYLVVAADKGTATFSDMANEIAKEYQFWLGDAFASGGSAGYDHKKMGITSKGTWESVKCHFRELSIDQDFTVVGVGDMSGDVFGNGMLQSPHIKLIAAFNHQHIFLDPTPDLKASFLERQRLFNTLGSTWKDYKSTLISKGGGVFERSQKRIPISPEVRKVLDIQENSLFPEMLIQAILRAPVDLLWFGGIGTFVKSAHETHLDVNDSANDLIRVNANELQVRVVAEGANLGMTQKARIEYALQGGRLNADFIDNSAGVDCSDHEVNLKILFYRLVTEGVITTSKRNSLLKAMTGNVTDLILQDNYYQNQILSQLEALGPQSWGRWQHFIHILEDELQLDRTLEYLPDDETIDRRQLLAQGPTRPELAVLLSYGKIALSNRLLASDLIEDPLYKTYLLNYFPEQLRVPYREAIFEHPLRKEILATVLANGLINRMGPLFVEEHAQALAVDPLTVVHTFFLIENGLQLESLWKMVESLDGQCKPAQQIQIFYEIQEALSHILSRFIREGFNAAVLSYRLPELVVRVTQWMPPLQLQAQEAFMQQWEGLPDALIKRLSLLHLIPDVLMIQNLTTVSQKQLEKVATTYFQVREIFGFGHLVRILNNLKRHTDWQETMIHQLVDDLAMIHTQLTLNILAMPFDEGLAFWQDKFKDVAPLIHGLHAESDLAYLSFLFARLKYPLDQAESKIR